jgi:lactate dehydrogenase-like 2-hydroxyacid dehydrogenase
MKPRIVVTRQMTSAVMERIGREFDAVVPPEKGFGPDEMLDRARAHGAQGLVFTPSIRLDRDLVARLPETVKILATCSVGFDHVDVPAAKARGLVVSNTPDVLNNATADMAFMLLLGAARRAHEYDAIMRKGWTRAFGWDEMLGVEVSGKTLGIVGMGRIGQAVARRAKGFDMKVIYHNRSRLPADREEGATWYGSLEDMLPHCHFVSIHAPGGANTADLFNARTLSLLPRGAILVNTARGTLVDEDALIAALKNGQLFAAGLDVFKSEPNADARFAELPNVFLAPHMGSATEETRTAMGDLCLDNIAAVLSGKPAISPL